jgi:hypothetical protein
MATSMTLELEPDGTGADGRCDTKKILVTVVK